MIVVEDETIGLCGACNKRKLRSKLRVTEGVTCESLYRQYFNSSPAAATCTQCLQSFNTWLENVYEELVKSKVPETTIATAADVVADEPSDLKCAQCDILFPSKKTGMPGHQTSRIVRFSLRSLKVSDDRLYAKGNFVCSNCRRIMIRKQKPATMPHLVYKPMMSAPKTLHV